MKNVNGTALTLYGEKEVTDVTYVVRIAPDSYNFTNNFTILSGSGRSMIGSEPGRRHGFNVTSGSHLDDDNSPCYTGYDNNTYCTGSSTMDAQPTTYVTGVQLYNENGTCVAVASLSKPFKKDFNRESVIKVKLTF